ITGTNGKTTTTSLTAKLIERAGLRVGMAGNIGPTLLDTLRLALEQEPRPLLEDEAAAAAGVPAETAPDAIDHVPDEATGDISATAEDAGIAAQDAQDAELDAAEAAEASEPAAMADDAETPLIPLVPPPPPAPTFEVLPEAWVLELSSFQLDGVSNFEPDAAVVLNVTQDHLDW